MPDNKKIRGQRANDIIADENPSRPPIRKGDKYDGFKVVHIEERGPKIRIVTLEKE